MSRRGIVAGIGAVTLGLAIIFDAAAAPAGWYLWESKIDGKTICLQTPPGEGWTKAAGPFKDAHCKMPA